MTKIEAEYRSATEEYEVARANIRAIRCDIVLASEALENVTDPEGTIADRAPLLSLLSFVKELKKAREACDETCKRWELAMTAYFKEVQENAWP